MHLNQKQVSNTAHSCQIDGSGAVRELEHLFGVHCQRDFALSVSNATMGIFAVVDVLQMRDSEFITTPLNWGGSIAGFLHFDNQPVFCDIDPVTLTIDPSKIEAKITEKTKAVLTCDILGNPCYLDKIKNICDKHGLWLIHDAAQSFGSYYNEKQSGYFADVCVFSLGTNKVFSVGEGGIIVTDNQDLYERLILKTQHPNRQLKEVGYSNVFSLNLRIHPLAAQAGVKQFFQALNSIKLRSEKYHQILSCFNHPLSAIENYQPNFFKLALEQYEIDQLAEFYPGLRSSPFSYTKLLFEEPFLDNSSGNAAKDCPIAKQVINNRQIISTNWF